MKALGWGINNGPTAAWWACGTRTCSQTHHVVSWLLPALGEWFGLGQLQVTARPAPGHTAGTELCSGAPVLSQLGSCLEEERGLCSLSGMLTFLASWPHEAPLYRVCPRPPSLGMAVFQRVGHFCRRGWEELPAPHQTPGWGKLSTCWRTAAQHSASSTLAPLAVFAGGRNTVQRCLKAANFWRTGD